MEVLDKTPDPEAGKKLRCRGSGTGKTAGCGALLFVMPRDIDSASYRDYGGGSDTSYWFVCPACSARTYVSWNLFSK